MIGIAKSEIRQATDRIRDWGSMKLSKDDRGKRQTRETDEIIREINK
jgi:hypothetical protein